MATPLPTPASRKKGLSMPEMLALVGQVGYMVAIPAFLFGFGGATLDKKFGTSPWLLIAGLALALTVSFIAVYRLVKKILPTP